MFQFIRKSRFSKIFVVFVCINLLNTIFFPTVSLALTSGPTQPEFQGFQPVGASQMVDLFSGDFSYNIPLFELPGPNGGYPFNISYQSGIGMDQEASWVGLGWSLNPGAINRSVRGYPDDFNGDDIIKTQDMKANMTVGAELGFDFELFGGSASKLGANLSLKAYYNTYKGIGTGIGFGTSYQKGSSTLGLSLDVDSQEGSNLNVSLGTSGEVGNTNAKANLGLSLHSKRGLSLSLGGGFSHERNFVKNSRQHKNTSSIGGSSSITFAERSFNPVMSQETQGINFNGTLDLGAGVMGSNPDMRVSAFYNLDYLKHKNEPVTYHAYGYDNLHVPFEEGLPESLLDFSREKDNIVTKQTPNLGIPSLTYDVYNIQGQGVGGMFRSFRSDYGHVCDPKMTSGTIGLSGGADIDPPQQVGLSGYFSSTKSEVKDWDDIETNPLSVFKFKGHKDGEADYEPTYFKIRGELTALPNGRPDGYQSSNTDPSSELYFVDGEKPCAVSVVDEEISASQTSFFDNHHMVLTDRYDIALPDEFGSKRVPRATVIEKFSNKELETAGFPGEFMVNDGNFDRAALPKDHYGAMSVLNPDGKRYIYALPAMNNKTEEYLFSCDKNKHFDPTIPIKVYTIGPNKDEINYNVTGSDNFYSKTETPAYAHSYLLTAVVGSDYVDLTGNGPSDDDYGYWVKFEYEKKESNYGWRAPYHDANYSPGLLSYGDDDKASFMYGEKEQWYVKSVETKSHIAIFKLNDVAREDGLGISVLDKTQKGRLYSLEKIDLYAKKSYVADPVNATPIKSVHFDYNYSLCPGIPNHSTNISDGTGKLTLTKLFFTYEKNTRGGLTPYEFEYNYNRTTPGYAQDRYDRWGSYAEYADAELARNFPYTQQGDRSKNDDWAASWELTKIKLPSGGDINVQYESDDYAYVQHRQATRMFTISELGNGGSEVYENTGQHKWNRDSKTDNALHRRVYFDLEQPVCTTQATSSYFKKLYLDGLARQCVDDPTANNSSGNKDMYQIYYKIKSVIKKNKINIGDDLSEYVSGYTNLDMTQTSNYGFADEDANGNYRKGYVTLESAKLEDKWGSVSYYHPFALASWLFIQSHKPDILKETSISQSDAKGSSAIVSVIASVVSVIYAIPELILDYTTMCFGQGLSETIDTDHSVIRLCSPYKTKLGGGSRVKTITYNDNWSEYAKGTGAMSGKSEASQSYGQYYEYTVFDKTLGMNVSSGVAAFEPMIGGEENALRWAKPYTIDNPFNADNPQFIEYPINESYYPGESVGYSKVKVYSLNSYNKLKDAPVPTEDPQTHQITFPQDSTAIKTLATGYSEHEFYTYKEFPIRFYESDISLVSKTIPIMVPLIGTLNTNRITAGQGYSIVLNDMHGKPKSEKYFAQPQVAGQEPKLVSSTEYYYKTSDGFYDGAEVKNLNNTVKVLWDDDPDRDELQNDTTANSITGNYQMGVEYEFFSDHRFSNSRSSQGGVDLNLDNFTIITLPLPWPSIYNDKNTLKTVVTNKIIHKAGILDHVKVQDENSVVTSYNEIWDPYTGEVLLTRTQNNFEEDVYNYAVPAYQEHTGMGPAYLANGYRFSTYNESGDFASFTYIGSFPDGVRYSLYNNFSFGLENILSAGDKVIFTTINTNTSYVLEYVGYYAGSNNYTFKGNVSLPVNSKYDCIVISSNANLLGAKEKNITALNVSPINKNIFTETFNVGECDFNADPFNQSIINLYNFLLNDIFTFIEADNQDFKPNYFVDNHNKYNYKWLPSIESNNNADNNPMSLKISNYIENDINLKDRIESYNIFFVTKRNSYWFVDDYSFFDDLYDITGASDGDFNSYLTSVYYDFKNLSNTSNTKIFDSEQEARDAFVLIYCHIGVPIFCPKPNSTELFSDFYLPIGFIFNSEFIPFNCTGFDLLPNESNKGIFELETIDSKSISGNFYLWSDVSIPPDFSYTETYSVLNNILSASTTRFDCLSNIWRPSKVYSYNDARYASVDVSTNTGDYDLKGDGVYAGKNNDKKFYEYNWNVTEEWPQASNWFLEQQITKYNSAGFEVENKNSLGIYSAAYYGYNNSVPVLVANNARESEIISVDFENPTNTTTGEGYIIGANTILASDAQKSHSGKNYLAAGGTSLNVEINKSILSGSYYTIQAWVHGNCGAYPVPELPVTVKVMQNGVELTSTTSVLGDPIENWQRIEVNFYKSSSGNASLALTGTTCSDLRLDDVRIMPSDAVGKSYVYNPENLRLVAELDENNFATFYYYDEQGKLYLLKKETEKGIQTIQESRSYTAPR